MQSFHLRFGFFIIAIAIKTTLRSFDAVPEMSDTVLPDQPVTFTVLDHGSKRGGRLLVSSDGYSYGVKVTYIT